MIIQRSFQGHSCHASHCGSCVFWKILKCSDKSITLWIKKSSYYVVRIPQTGEQQKGVIFKRSFFTDPMFCSGTSYRQKFAVKRGRICSLIVASMDQYIYDRIFCVYIQGWGYHFLNTGKVYSVAFSLSFHYWYNFWLSYLLLPPLTNIQSWVKQLLSGCCCWKSRNLSD